MRQTCRMSLERAAWFTTVGVFTVTAILLLVTGYLGYGLVFLVVAASAAVNLL